LKTKAEELFKEFREHSVSEFFRKNAAMLGYTGKIRSLTTVIHEGVTNAIDAAEEAGVLPKISVEIKRVNEEPEHFKVVIQDNASGIPEEYIPNVFGKMLAGTKLHRHMQSRGQQGIGISGAVMFSQITSGKPAIVTTSTGNGDITQMDVMIDVDKNEGKIVRSEKISECVFGECVFDWGKVPGNDDGRLRNFLKEKFGTGWVESAEIKKIDGGNAIKLSSDENWVKIRLSNDKDKATLKISDGKTDELEVKKKNGELNIYTKGPGTRVELEVKDVAYMRSRYGPFNYLRMTAISNPHVHITFVEPDGMLTVFKNATGTIPERPKPMPLHPWGIMSDDLLVLAKHTKGRTVASFLSSELSRVSKRKAEEVLKLSGVDANKKPKKLTWEEAEHIVSAFKQAKLMAPPTAGLRPIGAADIENGLHQILRPEFKYAVTRSPKVYRGGLPFIVEAGIAYGGGAGKTVEGKGEGDEIETEAGMELIRFANRAPLIFDQGGCAITTAARNIEWRRYGVDISTAPLTLFVNVVSAYVPYTSAGKQSIAEEPEVFDEIRSTIMDVARELKRFLYRKIRIKERQERAGVFEQYLPVIARKAASLAGKKQPDIKPLLKKVTGDKHDEES